MSIVKKFFKQFDMFSSYATLRIKQQPEIKNTCTGILSFALLLCFIYLFIAQFVAATQWQQITSIEIQNNTFDPTRNVSNFMVGVGLDGYRIEGIIEYLRFQIIQVTMKGSRKQGTGRKLKTEKCTTAHWPELKDSINQNFLSFDLANKLCISLDQQFTVSQPTTSTYKILKIQVNACRRLILNTTTNTTTNITTNTTTTMYNGCADENLTSYKNNLQITNFKYFVSSVVYINTAFNPLAQKPVTKFIQSVRLTFTIGQGTQAFVSLLTYQIDTDQSIFPFQQIMSQSGYSQYKTSNNNFQIVNFFEHASCTFSLSSTSILNQRNIGKVDEILSYAGGLFGIIISFLAMFMMSFNQYRYELRTAQSAFNYHEDGRKVREHDFKFFFYVKYTIFDWVKVLVCYRLNWQDCQQIDDTRDQAVKVLDVTILFRRIQNLENCIDYLISEPEKIAIAMAEPLSIQQVHMRNIMTLYYEKVIKGRAAVTIQDLNLVTGQYHFHTNNLTAQQYEAPSKNSTIQINKQQNILEFAILKYNQHRVQCEEDENVELEEDEQNVEQYMADAFWKMPEQIRERLQKKIPIKILKRIINIKNKTATNSIYSINLEI